MPAARQAEKFTSAQTSLPQEKSREEGPAQSQGGKTDKGLSLPTCYQVFDVRCVGNGGLQNALQDEVSQTACQTARLGRHSALRAEFRVSVRRVRRCGVAWPTLCQGVCAAENPEREE